LEKGGIRTHREGDLDPVAGEWAKIRHKLSFPQNRRLCCCYINIGEDHRNAPNTSPPTNGETRQNIGDKNSRSSPVLLSSSQIRRVECSRARVSHAPKSRSQSRASSCREQPRKNPNRTRGPTALTEYGEPPTGPASPSIFPKK
jgi:hypothetical protein